jgi:hypothetical protein
VRRPFEPPNELQVFTLLTGETEASMIDTLIDVTVDRILPGRSGGRSWVTVYCKLDNGMRGILPVSQRSARSNSELAPRGRRARLGVAALLRAEFPDSRTHCCRTTRSRRRGR